MSIVMCVSVGLPHPCMGVIQKGAAGCSTYGEFILQLKNIELEESIVFIASTEQICPLFQRQTLHHLSKLLSVNMTLRNGPSKEQSGLCILDKPSNTWRSPRDLQRIFFPNMQYKHLQEFGVQRDKETTFAHWLQVQNSSQDHAYICMFS